MEGRDRRAETSAENGRRGGRPCRFSDETLEAARRALLRAALEDDLPGDVRNELAALAAGIASLARR